MVELRDEKPKRHWNWYKLQTLLLVVLLVGIGMSLVLLEIQESKRQQQAYQKLDWDIYTCGGLEYPWYTNWLYHILGDDKCYNFEFLIFNNFCEIDDEKLAAVAQFENLNQLWLNGDISITDAGLEQIKGLKQLRELQLRDAPVSPEAVERLRLALPDCEIEWKPRKPDEEE